VWVAEHNLAANAGIVGKAATAADRFLMAGGAIGGFHNCSWAKSPACMGKQKGDASICGANIDKDDDIEVCTLD